MTNVRVTYFGADEWVFCPYCGRNYPLELAGAHGRIAAYRAALAAAEKALAYAWPYVRGVADDHGNPPWRRETAQVTLAVMVDARERILGELNARRPTQERGKGMSEAPEDFGERMRWALRVIEGASAQMQDAVDTIKANGNVVTDALLDNMLATYASVADLASGIIGAMVNAA